jgi:hypothetical protein
MKAHFVVAEALVGGLVAALTWSTASLAQETSTPEAEAEAEPEQKPAASPSVEPPATAPLIAPSAPSPRVERRTDPGANSDLIGAGLVTFALAYLPATIVASSSDLPADQHMYVPVIGPWLDLRGRPACNAAFGCDTETGYKGLLVADGVIQGLGALMTLAGILSPESPPPTAPPVEKPVMRVRVTPAHVGSSGYGLAAFGKF